MIDLQGFKNVRIGGLWHAGNYDPHDILGQQITNNTWVHLAEKSFFYAFDHNFFATDFHISMFCSNLLNCDKKDVDSYAKDKIIRTGWPMEFMVPVAEKFKLVEKENLVVFPHRLASEKQVEIFKHLRDVLPQYQFVICQEQNLTKDEYYTILSKSKIVFSASLQETLGISMGIDGPIFNAIPLCPNRLSYTEVFNGFDEFLYPSEWTQNWHSYMQYRTDLKNLIINTIENYDHLEVRIREYLETRYKQFYHTDLYKFIT